jgi:hypothetical protein
MQRNRQEINPTAKSKTKQLDDDGHLTDDEINDDACI